MVDTVMMPKLGFDMAEGTLVNWVKKIGDHVQKGESLAEIETDKATIEVESPYSGVVARFLVEENTSVPVGDPIAIITAPGEILTEQAAVPQTEQHAEEAPAAAVPQTRQEPVAISAEGARPASAGGPASPLARKIARDRGLDLEQVHGSGPGGRIVRRDVEATLAAGENAPVLPAAPLPPAPIPVLDKDERITLNKLRGAIGRRMVESKTAIPHFYVTHSIRMDEVLALRSQYNEKVSGEEKLSINDFIVKATALALRKFPNLNASLNGSELIRHGHISIGVAVSVENGLLTVVVQDADQKSLGTISAEVKAMAGRARQGKVKQDDVEGSTFSISNLGMYEVESFAAIINPPEAAILAIGSVRPVPAVRDGQIVPESRMNVTVSADHRVSDGVEAAQFLQEVARVLENPLLMLA